MSSFDSLVSADAILFFKSANAFDRPLQTQEKFADKLTNQDLAH
jgi:hypothetical protein